ncbi:MAG TPA: hypothetical protein VKB57_05820 [Acidimicrobiales bacterium]|nr:hypothetical protein [Acidimicrobiales bacterium]
MAGGWETWTWDPSLFAGAASYYDRGRLPYAPGLAAAFRAFDEAIGLDPDADMLAVAVRLAAARPATRTTCCGRPASPAPR